MTILGCWGEDTDLQTKAVGFTTGTGYGRTGYSRIAVGHYSQTVDSLSYPIASPVTSCWLSAQVYSGMSSTSRRFLGLGRSGFSGGIWLRTDASNSWKLALVKVNESDAETVLATETGASIVGLTRFDIRVDSFGASGRVRVYVTAAATPVIDTGAGGTDLTWASGPSNLDVVRYRNITSNTGNMTYISETILADEDTRMMSLVTLYPNAAGASNNFSVGTYAEVDENTVANDADVMSSATSGQHAELALSNLPAGNFTIKAVKVSARAARGASGPQQLKLGIRDNTAGISVDAGRTLDVVWGEYHRLMTTNPATAAAWAQSEIDPLQLAIESLT
jgi:hypothetical protein